MTDPDSPRWEVDESGGLWFGNNGAYGWLEPWEALNSNRDYGDAYDAIVELVKAAAALRARDTELLRYVEKSESEIDRLRVEKEHIIELAQETEATLRNVREMLRAGTKEATA